MLRSLAVLLALGGCQPPATTGPPPVHAEFTGKVVLSLRGARNETIGVEADECGARHVRLRIGARCSLAGTWVGEPSAHGTGQDGEWRAGTMSIDKGPACLIALTNGDFIALRVEGGKARMDDELLELHVAALGSAESFVFVGALASKRTPSTCIP